MNINEIKAEYREELKGAMVKLFQAQQSGQMDIATLTAAQDRLFNHYKALSVTKAAKTTKASKKASQTGQYAVKDLTSFIPKHLGDLYPTREAAESFKASLPFTVQLCAEVVQVS